MSMKETIVNECLNVLHRDDVKKEFKELMKPLIDMLIKEIFLRIDMFQILNITSQKNLRFMALLKSITIILLN